MIPCHDCASRVKQREAAIGKARSWRAHFFLVGIGNKGPRVDNDPVVEDDVLGKGCVAKVEHCDACQMLSTSA